MEITLDDLKKLYRMAITHHHHIHLLNENVEEADECVEVLDKFYYFIKRQELKQGMFKIFNEQFSKNKCGE